jgi:hypothetical protein
VTSRALVTILALLLVGCPAIDTSVGAWVESKNDASVPASSGLYIEAESGMLSGGFAVGNDPRASAQKFIEPPPGPASDMAPGSARARYDFVLGEAGDYVIWGRLRAPDAQRNRFWFQVDDGAFYAWRISTGDVWFWDDLHDDIEYGKPLVFTLAKGAHRLVLAQAAEGVALDRLYFTAHGDEPPGNDTPCNPPHSIEVKGECLPSCGSLAGQKCDAVSCAGMPLLPAYDCNICCRGP